jgi:hypothetical protein
LHVHTLRKEQAMFWHDRGRRPRSNAVQRATSNGRAMRWIFKDSRVIFQSLIRPK